MNTSLFFHIQNLIMQTNYFISDAKEQVLANLANFSYDPDNYTHIKELNIVDLFIGM